MSAIIISFSFCLVAFGYFSQVTGQVCKDLYVQCAYEWKPYCVFEFMKTICSASCGVCNGNGNSWSQCTRTCGGGTRFKNQCQGGQCQLIFEACSTNSCPVTSACYYPLQSRYGLPHACCFKDSGSECGNTSKTSRVFGGVSAQANQWSWMVGVAATRQTSRRFCGGVIISQRFVLTAAHCLQDAGGGNFREKHIRIHTGLLRLSDGNGEGETVAKITRHPRYSFPYHDIALVELSIPLTYTSTVQPICLPGGEITPKDSTCYVTGWGISEQSGPVSVTAHLQEAALKNLDRRICQMAYEKEKGLEHLLPLLRQNKDYLCAGHLNKRVDSCMGDSGGPLACQRCSSCTWYVAGIVSAGPNDCAKLGVPGIYTEVRQYEDWISRIIGTSQPLVSCPGATGP